MQNRNQDRKLMNQGYLSGKKKSSKWAVQLQKQRTKKELQPLKLYLREETFAIYLKKYRDYEECHEQLHASMLDNKDKIEKIPIRTQLLKLCLQI